MDSTQIIKILLSAPAVLIAITFHEAAHGYAAYRLGDPTAKQMGRLTLNPIPHIDPIGTVIMPAMLLILSGGRFMFGYAKPVPINPYNFKNPRRDMALSALAGPLTNIILAVISIILIRFIGPAARTFPSAVGTVITPILYMLISSAALNIVLAVFNMIPIPPLDGGRVAVGFLPYKAAEALSRLEPYGMMIVILLFFVLKIGDILIYPIVDFFMRFVVFY